MKKEVEELRRTKKKLTKEKEREIEVLKKVHEELEVVVADACEHFLESTAELDVVARANKIGVIIKKL